MADARRLIELGMVPALAKELAEQINAITPAPPTAADVSFDPEGVPGVTAESVQGAIAELAGLIDG